MTNKEKVISRKDRTNSNKVSFFNSEDMSKAFGILCLVLGAVLTILFGIIGFVITLVLGVISIVLGINAKKKDGCSVMVALTTSIIGLVLSGVFVTSCVAFGKYTGIGLFGFVGGSCISKEIIDMFK